MIIQTIIAKIICVVALSLTMSGCIGAGILKPESCSYSFPTPSMYADALLKSTTLAHEDKKSTKDDFLRKWGKPDDIQSNENSETWIYKRYNWCGIIPCFIVCAPLILPVCGGYDQLMFEGETAIHLISDDPHLYGFIFPVGGDFGDGPSQCMKW